jgi:hypothetical protein
MADTLLLTTPGWDLTVDVEGNIAGLTEEPSATLGYGSLAQDAASECRLFLGEAWYDQARGVPYWQDVLGQWPPLALVRSYLEKAAELTPNVSTAVVYFSSWIDRVLSGQVQVTDVNGNTTASTF